MKEISIRTKNDGTTVIETSGFKGNACLEETEKILNDLDALGISIPAGDIKKKAEFYETPIGTGVQSSY